MNEMSSFTISIQEGIICHIYACNNKFKMDIKEILSYIVGRELMSIITDNRLEERGSISGRSKGFFL
jgi:hypothetical protein